MIELYVVLENVRVKRTIESLATEIGYRGLVIHIMLVMIEFLKLNVWCYSLVQVDTMITKTFANQIELIKSDCYSCTRNCYKLFFYISTYNYYIYKALKSSVSVLTHNFLKAFYYHYYYID